MASASGTLYVGMTNNLLRRVMEHKEKKIKGFTQKYGCNKLVYYAEGNYVCEVIAREKQIKRWRRSKKEFLIRSMNPQWRDLSEDFSASVEMTKEEPE
jgi:putative endonuclease